MSASEADRLTGDDRADEPTAAFVWLSVAGGLITDDLLDWPPDVFALTNTILVRSEAFRFALTPADDWPPRRFADWA